MSVYVKVLALVYSILFLLVFFNLIRKRSIKPFYSALWLTVALFMFSFIVFEKQYRWLATELGIRDASSMIFVGLISFLFLYALYLSIKISEMSDRIQELISHSSILENEVRKLKENQKK